jgi:glycine cleavage system regulatory protein
LKSETNDLNHDLTFSAHTIKCECHSIRSMFRVLGIYNFSASSRTHPELRLMKTCTHVFIQTKMPIPSKTCWITFNKMKSDSILISDILIIDNVMFAMSYLEKKKENICKELSAKKKPNN